jgi:transposase
MTSEKKQTRRRYGPEVKALVVRECDAPGASVARVAMVHGINANVVHRWRQLAREGQSLVPAHAGEFISLPLPSVPSTPSACGAAQDAADIRVELARGPVTMRITWPVSAAVAFARWTRELLR